MKKRPFSFSNVMAGDALVGDVAMSSVAMSDAASRRGITLFEVLLSTVILLLGLTAIFHTSRSALQTMVKARELTEAQNACQAVLNELLAQTSPIEPHSGKTIEHLPNWRIRVEIYPAPQPRLFILHLSAQQVSPIDDTLLSVQYQLLRWVPAERVKLPETIMPEQGTIMLDDPFQELSW